MTDNTELAVPETPPQMPVGSQPDFGGTEEFSPAEREYFQSRGAKFDGLAPSAPEIKPADAKAPEPQAEHASGDDIEVDDITVDESGRARTRDGKFVSKSAYDRVREKYKSARDALQDKETKWARAEGRLEELNRFLESSKAAPKPAEGEKKPPSKEEDIFGYVGWLEEKLKAIESNVETQTKAREAERAAAELTNRYRSDAQEFAKNKPDFMNAYLHVRNSRVAQLQALGVSDMAAIEKSLQQEENALVQRAFAENKSPSQLLYNYATALGYKAAAPAAAQPDPKTAALAQIEQINKGQAAAASLSGTGTTGNVGMDGPSLLARIAEMSDDQYSAFKRNYIAKHGQSGWRALGLS